MTSRRLRPASRLKQRLKPSVAPLAASSWQLQAAKAKFDEVFRRARAGGPQLITRGGTDAAVVIPVEQYESLLARSRQPRSLVEFFRRSPLGGLELTIERESDAGRDVAL